MGEWANDQVYMVACFLFSFHIWESEMEEMEELEDMSAVPVESAKN